MTRLLSLLPALVLALALLPVPRGGGGVERVFGAAPLAAALGSAFTYQGVLTENGTPTTGTYSMEFRLYDAATGGTQVGTTLLQSVSVANGQFTVTLDFGAAAFTGDARWLEIAVSGTPLSPRQALTAAPYALFAPTAGSATGAWSKTGDSGTAAGTNFVGTTDNVPLELKTNGARALRLEPGSSPNVVGGHGGNGASVGALGASIGGGGASGQANRVTDDFGTVAGGSANRAGNNDAMTNNAPHATVGGGSSNVASGTHATVGGGLGNEAAGAYATVGGGRGNAAQGADSFAAGRRARANHPGAFVWGDSQDGDVASTDANQFVVRASGGIWFGTTGSPPPPFVSARFIDTSTGAHLSASGTWVSNSDRAAKTDFQPVDQRDLLDRLATLPIERWRYRVDAPEVQHLGPVAQDFYAAFGLGDSDRHLAALDTSGVALAAIQALYQVVQEQDAALAQLAAQKDDLLAALERQHAAQQEQVALLEQRLAALEADRQSQPQTLAAPERALPAAGQ